jgi:pilus assembly protein CpaB
MAAKRYTLIFYAAVIVAIVATFGVYRVLEATKASSRVATVPVVVAAMDVPEGSLIARDGVQVAQWPAGTQPAAAFTNVDSVVGRVARVTVFKGEVIVPGRLAPEGTGAGLVVKITPGKRAYGIRVNDVSSLAGMIMPNSRVDIMVVISDPRQEGKQVAKLFMSNMRVLAIGPTTQPGADGRPINAAVATIEVTPDEAEKLAIATTQGQIQLVLRGYGDPDSIKTQGANASDLVVGSRRAAPPSPEPSRAAPRRAPPPRPVVTEAPPAPIVVPQPKPRGPDTVSVKIIRGTGKTEEVKFQSDSARRDSTARRP